MNVINMLPMNIIFSYPPSIQLLYFALSLVIGIAGWDRKMGFWGYFFVSVVLSPAIGLMMVLVSDRKAAKKDDK